MSNYTMESSVLVLLLVNVFYLVSSIENPSSISRSNQLQVEVHPKHSTLHAGESVLIRCLVNGGARKDHFPRIGLYLQLAENTVIPISSDTPGVTVNTVAAPGTSSKYGRYSKSITYVTIGEDLYYVMRKAENRFICAASTSAGEHQKDYFIVWKVPYSME